MRALVLPFAILALSLSAGAAIAAAPQAAEVRASLDGLGDGKVALQAGDTGADDPFFISFDFERDGDAAGRPAGVGLQLTFGDYCRDRASWVEAVLIDPSGKRWSAHRVGVPQGPDRMQDWSSGYLSDPALIAAVEAGGQFTLALQDDEGKLWNPVTIDTPSPAQRQKLFASYSTAPAPDAVADPDAGLVEVVEQKPAALPSPPRACPAA